MLTKRIIPCLDVKNDVVIKGVRFRDHCVIGDIVQLAKYYSSSGADELVFYDITASSEDRHVGPHWISEIASILDIPFCVAGGIRTVAQAEKILHAGADKISINSPALECPSLIEELATVFGSQCVVVGIDTQFCDDNYYVFQYAGDEKKIKNSQKKTCDWLIEVQQRGAGEIVLNCMNNDGVKKGYDIEQILLMQENISVPLIASGGAGIMQHFYELFQTTKCNGALAASVFHNRKIEINELKNYLFAKKIEVRK